MVERAIGRAPSGILHRVHHGELFARQVGHCAPPLALARPHDRILRPFHPNKLLNLRPVLLVRLVDAALVVPLRELAVSEVRRRVDACGIAVVVGLEQDALRERVIRELPEHLGHGLAQHPHDWKLRRAHRQSANAGIDPTDRHEVAHRRIIVLRDVAANNVVALR